jgi:adenosylmethionine-8-amino-7-oxononanoate aminotransferase
MTSTPEEHERHLFHRAQKQEWPRISHGEGIHLVATDGRRYLDACAGVHVVSIGHGVEEIADAMSAQARKVTFTYARFITQPQVDLADEIAGMTPDGLNRVFFVSGGSEATESALKMARKYHLATGNPQKYKIISRWQSWHGNTIAAMSMSGRSSWRREYAPYLLDFPHLSAPIPYHCRLCDGHRCHLHQTEELERVILQEGAENISAFIVEPVLGTSACGVAPHPDFFPMVREICDRHNVLLIVDEVVTGFGRTGANFGVDHWDVVPDIMATGKGLSSGYSPIAATVAHDRIYDAIAGSGPSFTHGHTYGGNALSCATALAVQKFIRDHELIDRCRKMGDLMLEKLKPLEDHPLVAEVRGKGLLTGVEFIADKESRTPFDPALGVTARMVDSLFARQVLVMPGAPGLIDGVAGDHIAISPPFTVSADQVQEIVDAVTASVEEVAASVAAG